MKNSASIHGLNDHLFVFLSPLSFVYIAELRRHQNVMMKKVHSHSTFPDINQTFSKAELLQVGILSSSIYLHENFYY